MSKPKTPRMLNDNEALAKCNSLRVSPRKLGLVAGFIRNMKASDAVVQLSFMKKRIAIDVRKCLMSAIANAENNHNLNVDDLYVSEAIVGKALLMKRMRPRAKGRSARIDKFFSNLTIKVRESEGV
ncbi:50S ribosomal protein L22 [Candidatus Arcanobacter lacustris]|jgi:large subunit ribosomal protein L22|uniref:Large ribosomal subunit protein uL22 n=1 Tax=Candidatus Arcanibacter lacustris TaxID=1607817 RepID=A0A0F5MQT9_9RICK|nr:50S ribosomal protein L22 [Candidatus Arcanobacter lacustris]